MSLISHLHLDFFPAINKKTSRHPKPRTKWSLLWFVPKEILNRKDEITDYKGKAIKNENREGFFFYNRLACNICRIAFHTNGGLVDHQQEIHNKHSPSVRSRTILRIYKAGVVPVSIVNDKETEYITDLPSKSVAIKYVKEISWSPKSNVQTRPDISGDNIGKNETVSDYYYSEDDSLNLALGSNKDDQQSKSTSKVDYIRSFGLDSGNTDQQKLRDTFKTTRGCGRLLSRHVLRGQTLVGGRSPWRFRGRISMGSDVDRGRLNMVRGSGRVLSYQRCISPLSRGGSNLTLMRPELRGQRIKNQNYASTVNLNRSYQRPVFQSESSTFETRMKDVEGRVVVKQEEPEMIDLTEEPTIDRLQSYGISVSRVIVEEKEVQLPDNINLPSSITVTQPTPRPDCSSRQSF